MTVLYKLNNSGTVSWWEIERVEAIDRPAPDSGATTTFTGYNTWWGNDHKTRTRLTENTQFTPASNKVTMSVDEQIKAQIDEKIARKGYSREIPTSSPELPMLAKTWDDFVVKANSHQSGVEHWQGAYVQPKLDGIRCIATPMFLRSRRNLEFTSIPHIEMAMNTLLDTELSTIKLDGELYIEGSDLQTIQGTVSRKSPDPFMYRSVVYNVFDVVAPGLPTSKRLSLLNKLRCFFEDLWPTFAPPFGLENHATKHCPINFVETTFIHYPTDSTDFNRELLVYNRTFRNRGFEGTILRNPDSFYEPNKRTYDLLKYKEFADAEFLIVDVVPAKNDMGVFLCQTLNGKKFKCSPAWTKERKEAILKYKDNYIGRQLTVKYERLSAEGLPLKPIGVVIRRD